MSKAFDRARDHENSTHPNYAVGSQYDFGWLACKKEVLKILEQDWTGLDMSINSCDKYYIDKIKNEL